jgi:hypothetical protein
LLENISHQQFRAATKPKVQGSWNLHEVLPKKMDFFIMLSSIISITGNHGQSNYAEEIPTKERWPGTAYSEDCPQLR